MAKIAIFCDFDGTITEKDNIIAIMKKFSPEGWEKITEAILSQRISIREGVGKLFSLLPSSEREEILNFAVEHAVIRKGFKEFVEFSSREGIPLYIVSGGIDFFVHPILEGFGPFQKIFCNEADFSGDYIEIKWPNPCDENCTNDCGCCKPSIIRQLDNEVTYKIVIGDSVTDLEAAKRADFVLARELLLEKCKEWNLPHQSYETFFDVIEAIKKRIEVKKVNA